MSNGEFFCHGCHRWCKDAVKTLTPSGRAQCSKCTERAYLNAHQDTVVKEFPGGRITRANQLASKYKSSARKYKKTNPHYPE